jgi:hypothetical protein
VAPEPPPAPVAAPAREVDLADDALTQKAGAGRTLDAPDELVPRDPREGVVSAKELEVRVADPRSEHAHQGMTPARHRLADVAHRGAAAVEEESLHPAIVSDGAGRTSARGAERSGVASPAVIRCPGCGSELADSVRYCSSCGHAISSMSQMPTGLATPSVERAAQRRTPSSAPVGRLVSSDAIDTAGFTPGAILAERYRIIGLLGRGGMGEVYRADDLKLGQTVALKFLPRALLQDSSRLERFYGEVRTARQVSHPNVCRVYDVGEIEGQPFLSMEFVDGEDLASLLRRIGRLPADKSLDIARELCAGLAAAHDRGVLHRDLKPANVMIDGRGARADHRLRPGRGGGGFDGRGGLRNSRLHGAGAARGQGRVGPERHLRARPRPLRALDRAQGLRCRDASGAPA